MKLTTEQVQAMMPELFEKDDEAYDDAKAIASQSMHTYAELLNPDGISPVELARLAMHDCYRRNQAM
jgi:hypothetical protein